MVILKIWQIFPQILQNLWNLTKFCNQLKQLLEHFGLLRIQICTSDLNMNLSQIKMAGVKCFLFFYYAKNLGILLFSAEILPNFPLSFGNNCQFLNITKFNLKFQKTLILVAQFQVLFFNFVSQVGSPYRIWLQVREGGEFLLGILLCCGDKIDPNVQIQQLFASESDKFGQNLSKKSLMPSYFLFFLGHQVGKFHHK